MNNIDCRHTFLAKQRAKARIIRNKIANDIPDRQYDSLDQKVLKLSSLLSDNMVKCVKSSQLEDLITSVKSYKDKVRSQKEKVSKLRQSQHSPKPEINKMLEQIRKSIKMVLKNNKKIKINDCSRQKLNFSLMESTFLSISKKKPEIQNKYCSETNILLQPKQIKYQKLQKRGAKKRRMLQIKGKAMESQLNSILQKIQEIDNVQAVRSRQLSQQYVILRPVKMHKDQKQKLDPVSVQQIRQSFKPIGRIKEKTAQLRKFDSQTKNKNKFVSRSSILLSQLQISSDHLSLPNL